MTSTREHQNWMGWVEVRVDGELHKPGLSWASSVWILESNALQNSKLFQNISYFLPDHYKPSCLFWRLEISIKDTVIIHFPTEGHLQGSRKIIIAMKPQSYIPNAIFSAAVLISEYSHHNLKTSKLQYWNYFNSKTLKNWCGLYFKECSSDQTVSRNVWSHRLYCLTFRNWICDRSQTDLKLSGWTELNKWTAGKFILLKKHSKTPPHPPKHLNCLLE